MEGNNSSTKVGMEGSKLGMDGNNLGATDNTGSVSGNLEIGNHTVKLIDDDEGCFVW